MKMKKIVKEIRNVMGDDKNLSIKFFDDELVFYLFEKEFGIYLNKYEYNYHPHIDFEGYDGKMSKLGSQELKIIFDVMEIIEDNFEEVISWIENAEVKENKNFEILNKSLPEYLPEFFEELTKRIVEKNEEYGETWKERGLFYNGDSQEIRFSLWAHDKFFNCLWLDKKLPWLDFAGEAFIGFIREKYLKDIGG